MSRKLKVKRNDPCPCGRGKKYKHCCDGRVDWNDIIRSGADWRKYISVRGRNLIFANKISEALQLDKQGGCFSLKDYKAAFTAKAVREIYEAVIEVWPKDINIISTLSDIDTDVSGLYIGDYDLEYITRGLVRHSIYANKILIVDPFVYPSIMSEKFNPIINPEQYRAQTLKNVNFYFSLLPWIEAGIVEVIRTPADFDPRLNWESMERQKKKFEENEELKKASKVTVKELKKRHMEKDAFRNLILGAPDSYHRKTFEKFKSEKNADLSFDEFMAYVNAKRESDPDFLEPFGTESKSGQLQIFTTGASYDIAKITATITGSYLVTDLHVKWREIEIDRTERSAENEAWAPFAKAIQNARLKYLNELRLEHALLLRKEGRLERLRSFLHKVWRDACTDNPFNEANSVVLASEFVEEIRKAEDEWKQIDRDLLKIIGREVGVGLLAAGPLIASGHATFLAAASVAVGGAAVVSSTLQRQGFQDKFPAAFFMKIAK